MEGAAGDISLIAKSGTVIQMQAGDILGHEFCGVVDEMGSKVKGITKGGRYVASFQIACGDVSPV